MDFQLVLAHVLLLMAPTVVAAAAGEKGALDYLSADNFPGHHVLEPLGQKLRVYRDGLKPTDAWPHVDIEVGERKTMPGMRTDIEVALSILPREPYQNDWAFFDTQGTRLETVPDLMRLKVAFIVMIGQWMWPAVRVGFEQTAEGVLGGSPLKLVTLSVRPVVFKVDGFILPEETDAVVAIGKQSDMFVSEGVLITADKAAHRRHDSYRTSTQTWLNARHGQVVSDLDERTSNLTRVPMDHNEEVQLLRYGQGQFYFAHLDWSDLPLYNGQRAQWQYKHYGHRDRMATLFWYLNDVSDGGQTVFPKHGDPICPGIMSTCPGVTNVDTKSCDVGLRVKPKRGSVILWYNFRADGRGDHNALHGGCPPALGQEKWSGNKWIHTKSQRLPDAEWMPDHPALKRFGWTELEETQQKNVDNCRLVVHSEYPQSADLLWLHPRTKKANKVSMVESKRSVSMSSFKGHSFALEVGSKRTSAFICTEEETKFLLTTEFEVIADHTGEEL
eukprot:TRINITY_DN13950_c1_g1_i1.p1 TRINITY_DN13950_c1_g1~~TRINITY_DN13950_c1_g1_i1.p1  ORF type:complete len:501 (-),score=63.32 TRINITY_DN13950_c1_g1_i1:54-1556(-)